MLETEVLLTALLLILAAGAFMVAFVPSRKIHLLRGTALFFTTLTFLCSLLLVSNFDSEIDAMQFVQDISWFDVGEVHVRYHVGIDGISLFLVILTTFLVPVAVLASWSIEEKVKSYMFFMLLLEVGMIGVFISLDLILFYVFWEVMLVPMYFLIGVWGGERRIYAAVKFFIYTMAGSLLMLAAIISLYFFNEAQNFDLVEITQKLSSGEIVLSPLAERLLFLAFFLAFAVKVPLFPFHTWLPDAHVEAPTAGSVLLAGILLKMGTYGLLRFCLPMFPAVSVQLAPAISLLAIIGIIYGALVAMVQPDIKKLVAYSSISHLGFVVLGIFAFNFQSIEGATYQMLNHGVSTGALFLLVGMIYDRRHTHLIEDFGGLAHVMPCYAAFFMVIALSSIGLPGLNGFVGEFLILQGTFLENAGRAAFAASGIVLSAVYMLWMYQRVFMGTLQNEKNLALPDLNWREILILVPIVILALWMGLYSSTFLRKMDTSVQKVVDRIEHIREPQIYRVEYSGH
ncbi:NADH-quinone oxidoreductase subunit M [Acidobacteria bacterium AH-259-A15]|nr:NADH-quinone oxidoreductase subunit M [Acidobacteria bacterium AH-259-A15]